MPRIKRQSLNKGAIHLLLFFAAIYFY